MNPRTGFRNALLGVVVGSSTTLCACAIVMDTDYGKYQPALSVDASAGGDAAGAGGTVGTGGTAGSGGTSGTGGTGGACSPSVKINEVQTAGSLSPDDEFVELYNASACDVPLDGYELAYRTYNGVSDHASWLAGPGLFLRSGQFFVIGGERFQGTPDSTFPTALKLRAGGAGLALRDGSRAIVDSVGWGDATNEYIELIPVAAASPDQSMARSQDGVDTDNNGVDFILDAPTPGGSNVTGLPGP